MIIPTSMWGLRSLTPWSNLGPLHWKHWVLTTGPPGKSFNFIFISECLCLLWRQSRNCSKIVQQHFCNKYGPKYCFKKRKHKGTKALVFIDLKDTERVRREAISSFFLPLMTTPYIFPQICMVFQLTHPLGMMALCEASALLKPSSHHQSHPWSKASPHQIKMPLSTACLYLSN